MKKEKYRTIEEELAFKKELNILRNDFYYQLADSKPVYTVDFMYKPLETLSGDAYSARRIDEHKTFYLLVDGMGKGVSAAFTAVIMATFVNHLVDKMIEYDSFSLDILVQESMSYIQPILADEEVLAIDYICFDSYFKELSYAKFGMPCLLMQDKKGNIIKKRSNNPPMTKWQKNYKINTIKVENIEKYLFFSDGIIENSVKNSQTIYANYIEDDFKNSFTREEFKEKFFDRIEYLEDDISLIFLNNLDISKENLIEKKVFKSTLESVKLANKWYKKLWEEKINADKGTTSKANLVFAELFMNAHEHGNLGIDSAEKYYYLQENIYFDKLKELEQIYKKKIFVFVYRLKYRFSWYIVTQIKDEGEGFDTMKLSGIFRNSQKFNGRGVYISRKNSMGIYYNTKGNCVFFLHKI